jgi:hypothetical protein
MSRALRNDEIAIYRDFYFTTVAFVASMAFGDEPVPPNLEVPAYSGRKLPAEIMVLTDEDAVTARIAADDKLVDPRNRSPDEGPDGYVRTRFTLSEIAFDSKHEQAAFVYAASCGCKGAAVARLFTYCKTADGN